jgi:hypothetical protein
MAGKWVGPVKFVVGVGKHEVCIMIGERLTDKQ